MRSSVQKLLHPLCGRPIIAWPIAAARAAGAGQDRRRRLARAPARGGRSRRASCSPSRSGRWEPPTPCGRPTGTSPTPRRSSCINGDAPLITASRCAGWSRSHERSGAAATIATVVLDDPPGYGRVVRAPDGTRRARGRDQGSRRRHRARAPHPRGQHRACSPSTAQPLLAALAEVRADNAQGEHYLPDVLPILREHERTVEAYELADPDEMLGRSTTAAQLAEVTARRPAPDPRAPHARRRDDRQPGRDGDRRRRGDRPDTVIAPFTSLHGQTTVGPASTVGPAVDADRRRGRRAAPRSCTPTSIGAVIGDRVSVGPFAYLRPGHGPARGLQGGHVRRDQELRRRRGQQGAALSATSATPTSARAPTSGASTITANYDGYRKHRTTIGDAGQDERRHDLVAPVTVGDDAYTGAGSVISKDVPAGRARGRPRAPENIDGYAERRRERGRAERRRRREAMTSTEPSPLGRTLDRRDGRRPDPRSASTVLRLEYDKRLMLVSGRANPSWRPGSPPSSASSSAASTSRRSPTARSTAATRSRSAAPTCSSSSRPAATRPTGLSPTTR